MSTVDYTRSRATANRLIERFGTTATLRQVSNSGDGWNPTQSNTDETVKVALMNIEANQVDGTLIQQGDRMAYLSAEDLNATPATGDKLIVASTTYSVVSVDRIDPAGTPVVYMLQVRA